MQLRLSRIKHYLQRGGLRYNRKAMSADPGVAVSMNGVPIRLPEERWQHIVEGHDDLENYRDDVLRVIEQPDAIFEGRRGSLIAVRSYVRRGLLGVFYREISQDDGFVITARFLNKQPNTRKLWSRT